MTFTLAITGANGFVGPHVAQLAQRAGMRVWAAGREADPAERLAPFCDAYYGTDLTGDWPFPVGVDAVVHLAGLAAVGRSFSEPQRYLEVNSSIMTVMCETLLARSEGARVIVVSSGAVYAPPSEGRSVDEAHAMAATSPYAVAKLLVETQAEYYSRRGVDTVVARPFNHIGPGQGPGFLIPDLTRKLRSAVPGEPLQTGNLSTARDYTDVRDVAAAYVTLASASVHEYATYNVGSGRSHTGAEMLEALASALDVPVPPTSIDTGLLRPGDVADVRGDASRLRDEFGWVPTIDWRSSITDYVGALE
ncbi:NAD-dependent epimerase/dehydratase family protein [Microbacterium sp. 20-116]|uniref:NAD-dependent epimerase/dehydratase family protein n=1 Tax=Microbacterium sp. 20-116 TaxID=3239883 RepID=UPI0034E1AE47